MRKCGLHTLKSKRKIHAVTTYNYGETETEYGNLTSGF
jgi:hypothetical protein